MQMRHYLHNGKGYRALPYTKLKLMPCAFQPYVKLNLVIFVTYITFSQSGSHITLILTGLLLGNYTKEESIRDDEKYPGNHSW